MSLQNRLCRDDRPLSPRMSTEMRNIYPQIRYFFFLCLFFLSFFFLLCVAILCLFLFRPQGTASSFNILYKKLFRIVKRLCRIMAYNIKYFKYPKAGNTGEFIRSGHFFSYPDLPRAHHNEVRIYSYLHSLRIDCIFLFYYGKVIEYDQIQVC